jgi:hypothetical protein
MGHLKYVHVNNNLFLFILSVSKKSLLGYGEKFVIEGRNKRVWKGEKKIKGYRSTAW